MLIVVLQKVCQKNFEIILRIGLTLADDKYIIKAMKGKAMMDTQIITIKYTSAKRDGRVRFTSDEKFREWLKAHPEVRQYDIVRNIK